MMVRYVIGGGRRYLKTDDAKDVRNEGRKSIMIEDVVHRVDQFVRENSGCNGLLWKSTWKWRRAIQNKKRGMFTKNVGVSAWQRATTYTHTHCCTHKNFSRKVELEYFWSSSRTVLIRHQVIITFFPKINSQHFGRNEELINWVNHQHWRRHFLMRV